MRERSTWNRQDVLRKAASINKEADPYTMNQSHPQPPADEYLTGDPSAFAEDVHSPGTWKSEYEGGQTKRNEIGEPEMRGDTFNHAEKTATEVLMKKADLCIAIAQLMLGGKKVASEQLIEDQAVALMHLPDSELLDTHARLASDDEDSDDDDSQDEDEGQDKQAQQQSDDDDEGQDKQAQQQSEDEESEDKDADQQQGQGQQSKQAKTAEIMQQMAQQIVQAVSSGNYAAAQEQVQKMVQQAQQQMQQGQQQQQMAQQIQQMIQEAMGQMQQMPQQQVQQDPLLDDEETLDQMLSASADQTASMSEADIEMEAAPMDVGASDLGQEDAILRTLFAQDDEDGEQQEDEQQQDKQAAAKTRTASTRTVGTRPTGGVSKLGGVGAGSAGGSEGIEQLSKLWQSAPDVRDAFNLK